MEREIALAHQVLGDGPDLRYLSLADLHLVVGSGLEFDDRGAHELKGVA